ncbi:MULTISPECIES: transglycosylase domain-containing protein [Staphylococcus]|uniref:transglycosylase domain-containing protein n=1 Tax=Staphylococcus TaxID=1279 RepID=UPI0008A98828|nr:MULTISPECIES: transglycosylase domain-containing protein [Staphylococcus]MBX5318256.1 penicillin-binding protein [Staphylococcus caprae]MCI2953859.1 penicillin-binding protein [Staphylococcus caprae]MDI9230155.1 transglycosylase domain-containing protein [Staphylococcus caprae]OHO70197.1 transglycosylase [Staphylococcus sp. HMSC036D05]RIM36302.1 penicillin-binding protein [Staphylococcus caprae]
MTENKGSSQPKKNNSKTGGKSDGKKNRNVKRTIIKIIGFMIIAFFVLLLLGILLFAYYAWKAPAFTESKLEDPIPAKIYDKNGDLVKTLDNGQRHEHVNIKDVPKNMKYAVLATEDNRFYHHGALDYKRLFGAVGKNLTGGFGAQGASTLTQQVVKDSFLTQQKSIGRKAQEAYLSYRLEQEYSKDEIFQVYLNKIYYSDGVTGVKAAAKYYFNKDLKDLNLAEEAYLAGLPQVPNLYNIYNNPKEANDRKDTVLYLMHKHHRISDKQYADAKKINLKANLVERTKKERQVNGNEKDTEYDSYVNFVQSELMNNKYFKDKNLGNVLQSGIKIYTNMDKDVQKTLQDRIDNGGSNYYKNDDQQVGATILDSKTGGLVAISGGRNYKNVVERNQATDAHPTGSSLKPFLAYGPAIENMQWATNHAIQDESSYWVDGSEFRNYDTKSHGNVSAYDALRQSFNIPALKTWQQVKKSAGNDAPKKFASKVGLDYSGKIGPSEVLGGSSSEFSPTQLASAFAAIANGGTYNNAHSIQKVVTHDGDTIEYDHSSHKAMKDYTAYMLAEILKGTFKAYGSAYGHGVSGVNLGAKTGTGTYGAEIYQQYNLPDSAAKDVWINGFSPQYTMSVWMGFNKVKQYGTNSFVGHSQQEYPQYLFQDVMSDISSKDGEDFKKPKDVNGSDGDNLSVAGHPDNNTTNRSVHGDSDTSSSSSSNGSSSSSNSSSGNTNGSSQSSSGNALTRLFNLNTIFDDKAS